MPLPKANLSDAMERSRVMLLANLTGVSKAEIARREGISPGRVAQLIERGVKSFQTMKGSH